MNQQQITVCGCGWLGLPLAAELVKQGFLVFGTKQLKSDALALNQFGIQGIPLSLPVNFSDSDSELELLISAFCSDFLIINVPPGRTETSHTESNAVLYKRKIQSLSNLAKQAGCKKIIFISTTSVYADCEGEVTEDTPTAPNTESGHAHVWLENWLQQQWQDNVVIVRLSGLIGTDRHPAKHIVKRFENTQQPLDNGLTPVNLIHQHDVIQAISNIVCRWPSRKVLHLAASTHPSRAEYYQAMANELGLTPPQFVMNGSDSKLINAQLSCQELGLALKYDDLMAFAPYQ
ncbi:NAD-dependent epimerase/dehydratase family protein [Vibrio gangliei]|uniref:NAD-dependent epimerase/dehydratase family protein n=1 Tax=Vibrio gangliei TaxID=2077090 RepID=UPI001300B84E|nr:NAD-dependent epimerase/dehydratase family protein [Vibrio gangliei]